MNFGMIKLNQSFNLVASKTEQNYVTLILTALLFILKLKIFMSTLLTMLKNCFKHLTIMKMIKEHFQ